jgi:hypothetical protein
MRKASLIAQLEEEGFDENEIREIIEACCNLDDCFRECVEEKKNDILWRRSRGREV